MQTLLAILLYLGFISSPNTYVLSHINQLETTHQIQIDAVENDPGQMMIVEQDFYPMTDHIVVIDDTRSGLLIEESLQDSVVLFN